MQVSTFFLHCLSFSVRHEFSLTIESSSQMPLNPTVSSSKTELPARGAIAMATNGVPAYGPMEASDTNAVEPDANSDIQDAQYWYGHAAMNNDWHVHNPHLGKEDPSSDTLLAYAFDGFPIYGPLSDASVLDDCNGRTVNGNYQYHVRVSTCYLLSFLLLYLSWQESGFNICADTVLCFPTS